MKPQDEIAALKKENAELQAKIKDLESQKALGGFGKGKSKSRADAEAGLKMLEAGPVTSKQFAELNSKYPADIPYNIRTLLKIHVNTVRTSTGTVYMLDKDFEVHQAEKLKQSESEAEATEAIHQAQTPTTAAASV